MANLQDGGGKQRHRRQMSPSPADPHDWEQIHNPALDSLPYRTRSRTTHADDNTRMPDTASRRTQHSVSSSHRSRRASEDLRESMMPPTTLNRPRAVSHSTGKALLEYEDDDETGNAPSEARGHQSRPRLKYRARSRSRSMSDSERSSSRSEFVMTPTRSARGNPSTPNSRHSSRYQSNRRSRSIDSTSDVSTQCEVKEILRRHAAEVQVVSDDEQPGQRRHRRRHRKGNSVIPEEEPTSSVRHVVPVVADGRSVPSRRHRHQSDSRSDSRRRPHQQHDRQEAIVKPFNPTRYVIFNAIGTISLA